MGNGSGEVKNETEDGELLLVRSSRFGEFEVPANSVIEFPHGLIGFQRHQKFVMLDHTPPFSWLQSVDDENLAFVVVDGFQFGENYKVEPPRDDTDCDFQPEDEYAILVIVTVRPDPTQTTANLKAPLFVNLKNRKGVQVIFDVSEYSTRFPLWAGDDTSAVKSAASAGEAAAKSEVDTSHKKK